jgi:hypothetical protein
MPFEPESAISDEKSVIWREAPAQIALRGRQLFDDEIMLCKEA